MKNTIEAVCGDKVNKKCGENKLTFRDKLNSFTIIKWPYKGFSFDAQKSKLILDPAQAFAHSVITVTISLENYRNVTFSEDIKAWVKGGKPEVK